MKRIPIFATLFTLAACGVLVALGFWQLERLAWKTDILNALGAEYAKDAANAPLASADIYGDFRFRRGTLRGVYLYDKQIMLGPRFYESFPGFHVLTPLRLENGAYILVNRGWVPRDWTAAIESIADPGAEVSVTGLLRKPDEPNPFTHENAPGKNEWYRADTAQIAAVKDIPDLSPYILYMESEEEPVTGHYPLAQSLKPELPNNHLYYAIFWFTMAGILVVIYALRFLRGA